MIRQNVRLTELLSPVVSGMGYELWGIEYLTQSKPIVLRVYIDKFDGVDIDDCQAVSKQLVGVLDVEDPIPGSYNLEVSSPGVDRVLFSMEQCERFVGEEVTVRLAKKLDGRRRYKGRINSVLESVIILDEKEQLINLPADQIDQIRLIGKAI